MLLPARQARIGAMAMFKGLMGGAAGVRPGCSMRGSLSALGECPCVCARGAARWRAGAAMYTAYRDSDTIFSSKDLATGLYDYWQKKGAGNIAEVGGGLLRPLQRASRLADAA